MEYLPQNYLISSWIKPASPRTSKKYQSGGWMSNPLQRLALPPMRRPADPKADKSVFNIDDQAQTATRPQGQTVPPSNILTDPPERTACTFVFERMICQTCPWFTRCATPYHRTHSHHFFHRIRFPAPSVENAWYFFSIAARRLLGSLPSAANFQLLVRIRDLDLSTHSFLSYFSLATFPQGLKRVRSLR